MFVYMYTYAYGHVCNSPQSIFLLITGHGESRRVRCNNGGVLQQSKMILPSITFRTKIFKKWRGFNCGLFFCKIGKEFGDGIFKLLWINIRLNYAHKSSFYLTENTVQSMNTVKRKQLIVAYTEKYSLFLLRSLQITSA